MLNIFLVDTEPFSDFILNQQLLEIETMDKISGQHDSLLQMYGNKSNQDVILWWKFWDYARDGKELHIFLEYCAGGTLDTGLQEQDVSS